MATPRITILGAGFAGLELSTLLSEALGDQVQVTLIDQSDAFVFGFSKLDVMFGRSTLDAVRMPYSRFAKPGVRLLRESIHAIDPETRCVTTDAGTHDCDYLVVALGADYDIAATPGLESANEFYTVAGANRLRGILPGFSKGHAVIGVCGAPYKCPPAPSECALMLHDLLASRGVREQCEITLVLPLSSPVPPSPETSRALMGAFAERGIRFMANRRVSSVDAQRGVATLDDGTELAWDLFLGVPKHRAPAVVQAAGMAAEDGWVPVNPRTLETRFPKVYAAGDIANTGTPKAGVFAEGAAKAVASALIARIRGEGEPSLYAGAGTCYIEFGAGRIGRVDVDFFSGPKPTGTYHAPDVASRVHKEHFGASRRARWFGL
ncbi:NAD(P)/FAD-dependent oxidoreductase [Ramlibacter sp. WS9]|uniref:NAD(P)/FAD-dependent oxidoreductase n=1 Tax=Ramlibacter sp. WS9 TaxID=1882741 RepID=UPI001144C309|nr:FAD-dependent oxidoreductase [Ramlibacter sp. WS9]ROZ78914.1 NAD(P)/FAD-dependent oxidoreductase [Ramlibacter sp. WS9]